METYDEVVKAEFDHRPHVEQAIISGAFHRANLRELIAIEEAARAFLESRHHLLKGAADENKRPVSVCEEDGLEWPCRQEVLRRSLAKLNARRRDQAQELRRLDDDIDNVPWDVADAPDAVESAAADGP